MTSRLDREAKGADRPRREGEIGDELNKPHSCLTDPRVVELVEAAKDVMDVFNGPASSQYRWVVRLRTALAAFKGEKSE